MQTLNPAGTDGFEFLEFTTPNPAALATQFATLGFIPIAEHREFDITLYEQNDIRFIINSSHNHLTEEFAKLHGPSTCAMGFRVNNAEAAFKHALQKGAQEVKSPFYNIPAIAGVGGSLIYFIDAANGSKNYAACFDFFPTQKAPTHPIGLTYLDHVTHNLYRGNMDKWADFYETIFNFREVRYFDIEGRMTGLKSRAMTSPCNKIRIPLNESADDKSQIEEFLKNFNGEGIQHIALGTDDIYDSVEKLHEQGIVFLNTPDTYYQLIEKRLPNHGEATERLQKNKILIDGSMEPTKKLLLQIFTQNMLGPVFFEIIQRKGDEGFGEGNFRALFESIELDQINRGVLNI